jgi:DNA-binding response OmpR family regulator/tetratricopeptide (TPR) repeat protein
MAGYVLVVESDAELQRQIGTALRDAGFDLHAEAEASWAKRTVGARVPDVVVVDTRLTDGDGFAFADELRQAPETRATPIVFVASTHRGVSHRAEARRRFAPADYLPTPLDLGRLAPRVAELAARGTAAPAAHDDTADLVTPPPVPKESLRDPAQQRERRDVERSAKSLAADADDAELQGTLKRTPFPRLLQRLYAKRVTGSLLLLRDTTKKIVVFVEGYPVLVRSNVLGETLGRILLEKRLITSEILAESVGRMQKEKRHQGEILVEMGALSPFNLERALVEQVEAKLFEVFSWPDGKYMFKAGGDGAASTNRMLERSPAGTILEGIRRHYDEARQQAALEKYAHQYVGLTSDPVLRLQDMTSDPVELAFIQSIDGTRQLEAILENAEIARDKARLLLVALSEAGMLQRHEATTRKKGPSPVAPPVATLPVLGAPAAPPPTSAPLASGQLSMMLQTVRTQDYFWALDVERDAPADAIDRAYEALARSFHADRYRLAPEDDRKTAQEIFDKLTEAHRTLRDPAKRKSYLAKLSRADDGREEAPVENPIVRARSMTPAPPSSAAAAAAGGSPSNAAARALYEVGLEHLKARRHHEAVEALRQAARLVPNEADFRAALGWALFRQAPADARAGRAAVAELRRALQLDERHRAAAQHLAEIYAQTGQPDLAVQELERLLAIDPTATEVAEELNRLRTK